MMLINMFFYGAGESIRSLNVKDVERRAEENDKKAIKILKYIEKPPGFVNSMQIIVTTTNIVIGMILLQRWAAKITGWLSALQTGITPGMLGVIGMVIAAFLLLYILLTFGILLPKQLSSNLCFRSAHRYKSESKCSFPVMPEPQP